VRVEVSITRALLNTSIVPSAKRMFDRMVFMDFTLHSVLTANSRLAKVVSVKFAARPRVCAGLCATSKYATSFSAQHGGRPSTGIAEIPNTEASTADISIS
jgi:hypothetical protein